MCGTADHPVDLDLMLLVAARDPQVDVFVRELRWRPVGRVVDHGTARLALRDREALDVGAEPRKQHLGVEVHHRGGIVVRVLRHDGVHKREDVRLARAFLVQHLDQFGPLSPRNKAVFDVLDVHLHHDAEQRVAVGLVVPGLVL